MSKIADPGVVINDLSAFPADVTPVASAMPPFLDSTENAPVPVTSLEDSTSASATAPRGGSILSSEEVDEGNVSPPSK